MAISVLKVSKEDEKQVQVLGEFWDAEIARKFADFMQGEEGGDEFEFVVEAPTVEATTETRH